MRVVELVASRPSTSRPSTRNLAITSLPPVGAVPAVELARVEALDLQHLNQALGDCRLVPRRIAFNLDRFNPDYSHSPAYRHCPAMSGARVDP
jgi:hypothetical protein